MVTKACCNNRISASINNFLVIWNLFWMFCILLIPGLPAERVLPNWWYTKIMGTTSMVSWSVLKTDHTITESWVLATTPKSGGSGRPVWNTKMTNTPIHPSNALTGMPNKRAAIGTGWQKIRYRNSESIITWCSVHCHTQLLPAPLKIRETIWSQSAIWQGLVLYEQQGHKYSQQHKNACQGIGYKGIGKIILTEIPGNAQRTKTKTGMFDDKLPQNVHKG